MYWLKLIIHVTLIVLFSVVSPDNATGQDKITRKGLFFTELDSTQDLAGKKQEAASIFSLGTMFGVTFSPVKLYEYSIRNGIVESEDKLGVLPAVYAFPSINIAGSPGNSWGVIVPINLNPASDIAVGFGITRGFNVSRSVEIGIGVVAIWSDISKLDSEQEKSLQEKTPLPDSAPVNFGTKKSVSVGVGIYITPLL